MARRIIKSGELPPRTRRILPECLVDVNNCGTTSAYAENTVASATGTVAWWNYLRVRGEYWIISAPALEKEELPPRARRIPIFRKENLWQPGNYLRVRGEYPPLAGSRPLFAELPPRARRIPWAPSDILRSIGTTSACAENTFPAQPGYPPPGNYLRVRGEYAQIFPPSWSFLELPPRARRIRQ